MSRNVVQFKDKDNNIYYVKDANAREEIGSLKSAIDDVNFIILKEITDPATWSIGGWSTSTGTAGTNNKRIRTANGTIPGIDYIITSDPGVLFYVLFYGSNGYIGYIGGYVSYLNTTEFIKNNPSFAGTTEIRLVARTDPESTLTSIISETAAKIHFHVSAIVEKLDKYQGTTYSGKSMIVNSSGNIVPGVSDKEKESDKINSLITIHMPDNLCNPADIVIGRLEEGGTIDTSVTSNATSGFIPVSEGDSVQIYRNDSGNVSAIYHTRIARYDANKNFVRLGTSSSNNPSSIEEGNAYIRYSFDSTYTIPMIAVNYTGTAYSSYYPPYITTEYDFLTDASRQMLGNAPMRGKKIVNFGDSIFGNFRSETTGSASESISHMVQTMTGATCYNCAFGGTHAKTISGTSRAPLDFQSLVTAIISDTWTDQEAYATAQGEAYLARVQALEAIDFNTIDIVTVSYGTNDFTSQVTPTQYGDALTDGITRLLTAFPNLLCVVCTPIIRFKHSDDPDSEAEDTEGEGEGTGTIVSSDTYESSSGYKLTEYAQKAEDIGKTLHCLVSENYWSLGINLQNYTTFMGGMAEADMVHPNAKGRRLIANHLANTLVRL